MSPKRIRPTHIHIHCLESIAAYAPEIDVIQHGARAIMTHQLGDEVRGNATILSIDGAGKVPLDDGFKAREKITEQATTIVLPTMLRE